MNVSSGPWKILIWSCIYYISPNNFESLWALGGVGGRKQEKEIFINVPFPQVCG